jgi:type I restriction enzyme S subunit
LEAARNIFDPVYGSLANLQLESRKVAELRDYLLPKLLSGEVRVGDAA